MKKYLYLVLAFCGLFNLTACDPETNEEPGGTAVEKMAGTWTVTFQQSVDEYNALFEGATNPQLTNKTPEELDKLSWEDMYGTGKLTLLTYNTAANTPDVMWFDIDDQYMGAKVKCNVNYPERTFTCQNQETSKERIINIIGGKVMEGAATTPRGMKADSIVAYVYYSDDSNGFTYMKMSGYRYTGFNEDK